MLGRLTISFVHPTSPEDIEITDPLLDEGALIAKNDDDLY
jgi:hypothetical protein